MDGYERLAALTEQLATAIARLEQVLVMFGMEGAIVDLMRHEGYSQALRDFPRRHRRALRRGDHLRPVP